MIAPPKVKVSHAGSFVTSVQKRRRGPAPFQERNGEK